MKKNKKTKKKIAKKKLIKKKAKRLSKLKKNKKINRKKTKVIKKSISKKKIFRINKFSKSKDSIILKIIRIQNKLTHIRIGHSDGDDRPGSNQSHSIEESNFKCPVTG